MTVMATGQFSLQTCEQARKSPSLKNKQNMPTPTEPLQPRESLGPNDRIEDFAVDVGGVGGFGGGRNPGRSRRVSAATSHHVSVILLLIPLLLTL